MRRRNQMDIMNEIYIINKIIKENTINTMYIINKTNNTNKLNILSKHAE